MKCNQSIRMILERKRSELTLKLEFLIKNKVCPKKVGYKKPSKKGNV